VLQTSPYIPRPSPLIKIPFCHLFCIVTRCRVQVTRPLQLASNPDSITTQPVTYQRKGIYHGAVSPNFLSISVSNFTFLIGWFQSCGFAKWHWTPQLALISLKLALVKHPPGSMIYMYECIKYEHHIDYTCTATQWVDITTLLKYV